MSSTVLCEYRRVSPRAPKAPKAPKVPKVVAPKVETPQGTPKLKRRPKKSRIDRAIAKAKGAPIVVFRSVAEDADNSQVISEVSGAVRVLFFKRYSQRGDSENDGEDAGRVFLKLLFVEFADETSAAAAIAKGSQHIAGSEVTFQAKKEKPVKETPVPVEDSSTGGGGAPDAPVEPGTPGKKRRRRRTKAPRKPARVPVEIETEAFIKTGLPAGITADAILRAVPGAIEAAPRQSRQDVPVAVVKFGNPADAAAFVARESQDVFGAGPCEIKRNRVYQAVDATD